MEMVRVITAASESLSNLCTRFVTQVTRFSLLTCLLYKNDEYNYQQDSYISKCHGHIYAKYISRNVLQAIRL